MIRRYTLITVFFGYIILSLKLFLSVDEAKAAISPSNPREPQVFTVVIDPGHGGTDSGAVRKLSEITSKQKFIIMEKQVTLDLAKRLRRTLQSHAVRRAIGRPVRVFLTREHDQTVSLDQRGRYARSKKPDLFISLHMNSEPTGQARGFETYFLNNTTIKADAHQVKLNNRHRLDGTANSEDLSLLLRSVMTDASVTLSQQAATIVQEEVAHQLRNDKIPLPPRGVRQSLLQLLLDTEAPAVLFEGLFLSNSEDLQIVRSHRTLDSMAQGLARGITKTITSSL